MSAPTNSGTALATMRPASVIVRPVAPAATIIEAHRDIAALVAAVLEPGIDYGTVPGTDRPTLLKAGAERLTVAVGAVARFFVVEQEVDHLVRVPWRKTRAIWEGPRTRRRKVRDEIVDGESFGLYRYVVRCELRRRDDDALLGEGLGSCSTLEARYCDRPRECENTVLKMAQKRAHVAAVLSALGLSSRFERDEDLGDEDGVVRDPTDGLTLTEAMGLEVRGQSLGSLPLKALKRLEEWAREVAEQEPTNGGAARRLAAVELVRRHREAHPVTEAAAATATEHDQEQDAGEDEPGAADDAEAA